MNDLNLSDEQTAALKEFGGDAEALVEEASDPSSPLHDLFNWDDATAAGARLERAEQLLGAVTADAPAGGEDDEAASAAAADPAPAADNAGEGGAA